MRNVLVTGGSRGLGLAIARELQREGFRVIAVARHESADLAAAKIAFCPFDLAETAAIPSLVRRLRKEFGPFYGLVNNAAIGTSGLLATTRDEALERLVRLNTLSPLLLTKYVVRTMLAAGDGGRIVNVASIAAITGYSGLAAYGATKAYLLGLGRALAREVGAADITVNAVAPGFIDTDMTHGMEAEERVRIMRRSALGRFADPADVAHAVAFLMSEKARNVTGTVLPIDGGTSA